MRQLTNTIKPEPGYLPDLTHTGLQYNSKKETFLEIREMAIEKIFTMIKTYTHW